MIFKSETNTEDMVSILEDLHSYVPTTSLKHSVVVPGQDENFTVTADGFHYIVFGEPLGTLHLSGTFVEFGCSCLLSEVFVSIEGGDQLTAARAHGSQTARNNSV